MIHDLSKGEARSCFEQESNSPTSECPLIIQLTVPLYRYHVKNFTLQTQYLLTTDLIRRICLLSELKQMEKFKEKINQLKLEIDGSNTRADVAEKKLSALSQQLAAKGYDINVIIMIMTF